VIGKGGGALSIGVVALGDQFDGPQIVHLPLLDSVKGPHRIFQGFHHGIRILVLSHCLGPNVGVGMGYDGKEGRGGPGHALEYFEALTPFLLEGLEAIGRMFRAQFQNSTILPALGFCLELLALFEFQAFLALSNFTAGHISYRKELSIRRGHKR